MKNALFREPRVCLSRLFCGLFAVVFAIMSQRADAQNGATFRISENANVLKAALDFERNDITQAEYDAVLLEASCQNPASRLQARNRPYILVQNTSVADEITSIVLDLTRPGFEFGNGDITGDGFDGLFSMLASRNRSDAGVQLTSANIVGNDSTQLQLNFSGLTAGSAAIFRFDLDEPGSMFEFPDFRVAMQGADRGNGSGLVATVATTFSSGETRSTSFPREQARLSAGFAEAYHTQTMIPPPITVPEPSTALLLLTGLTAVTAAGRRRR